LTVGGTTPAISSTVRVRIVHAAFQVPVMVSAVSISVVATVKFARNSVFDMVPLPVAFVAPGNVMIIVSPTEYTASASSGSLATADVIGDAANAS